MPALLLIAAGAGVRLYAYWQRPSMWIDEAMLGVNILYRSPAELLAPLDFEQIAPILFLLAEKAVTEVFGSGEWALRALPMLSGVATVALFPLLLRTALEKRVLISALALLAFSPLLVRYGNEVKPYAVDVLLAVIILGWTLRIDSHRPAFRMLTLAALGMVSIALSIPSIFSLATVALYVAYQGVRARAWRSVTGITLVAGVWAAEFVVLDRYLYHADPATNAYLERFWRGGFLFARSDLGFAEKLNLTSQQFLQPLLGRSDLVSIPVAALMLAVLVAGSIHLIRHRPQIGFLVLAPVALVLIAFAFRQYVVTGRMILFLAPSLALIAGQGLGMLAGMVSRRRQEVVWAALTLTLVMHQLVVLSKGTLSRDPTRTGVTRASIKLVLQHAKAEEPLYIFARTIPIWLYYTTNWERVDSARVNWWLEAAAAIGPNSGNGPPTRAVSHKRLARRYRQSWELAGSRTGMETLEGWPRKSADLSEWAGAELQRIAQYAKPTVWLVFSQEAAPYRVILAEARARSGAIDFQNRQLFVAQLRLPAGSAARVGGRAPHFQNPGE